MSAARRVGGSARRLGRARLMPLAGAAVGLLTLASMSGCVRPQSCDTGPGVTASSTLAELGCRADRGDKLAMLALARRLDTGDGARPDPRRAAVYYRLAASFTSGTTWIYSPGVGRKSSGRVIPVRTGSDQAGLPEAGYWLALLYRDGRGVRRDPAKARRLLERAARDGCDPAARALRDLAA